MINSDVAARLKGFDRHALSNAFRAYYEQGEDPAALAVQLEQTAGRETADAFLVQWRADLGEYEMPETPDEIEAAWEMRDSELEAIGEQVAQARADAEVRRVAEQTERVKAAYEKLPLAQELAPYVSERVQREVSARGVTDIESALPVIADVYSDGVTRFQIADDARFQAEQSQPFGSTRRAEGWLTNSATIEDQFPSAARVAAERERRIQEREADIYQQHAPSPIELARPPRFASETEEQAAATARFQLANAQRVLGDEVFVKAPKVSATETVVGRFEQGIERSRTFTELSNGADAAAREGRQRRDFWNGISDMKGEEA